MTKPVPDGDASLLARWQGIPLYLRILGACALGAVVGALIYPLSQFLTWVQPEYEWPAAKLVLPLEIPSKLVLRLLGALATPLVFAAIVRALMHAQLPKGSATRLVSLLMLNTLVAICIGLLVANVMRPGKWTHFDEPTAETKTAAGPDLIGQILDNVPRSVLGPFGDEGRVLSVIMLAVAFGVALRRLKQHKISNVADVVEAAFQSLLIILHWIIEVIPFAVFGIVASIIAVKGVGSFVSLGGFVLAVLIALSLQTAYYLVRIRFGSWCDPLQVVRDMRDALVMAFSTGSSTATMPVTYACLREKVGLRERSASLGSLVGANFNNDGTALYEAMSALFISQMIGQELSLWRQVLVVLTSVVASVGAAGIPEAGIVTMTLVLTAVGLPVTHIPLLLTVDWFLDRCRTTVNVLGDVNVSCLLDGHEREDQVEQAPLVVDEPVPELVDDAPPPAKASV